MDAFPGAIRYRHREHGWELALHPIGDAQFDINSMNEEQVRTWLQSAGYLSSSHRDHILNVAWRIQADYETVRGMSDDQRRAGIRALLERVPAESRFVLLLDHDHTRDKEGVIRHLPFVTRYNSLMASVIEEYPYAAVASFTDVIQSDDEIQTGGNHYNRVVYHRIAERLSGVLHKLPGKADPERARRPKLRSLASLLHNRRAIGRAAAQSAAMIQKPSGPIAP
jgi:hypothetical protein